MGQSPTQVLKMATTTIAKPAAEDKPADEGLLDDVSMADEQMEEDEQTGEKDEQAEDLVAVGLTWSEYCPANLFGKGQELLKVDWLVSYMQKSGGVFHYGAKKPNKETYMLTVRNTPPLCDRDHPFWSTME